MQAVKNPSAGDHLFDEADSRALGIARILVPTKFTALSEQALSHAVELAMQLGASVMVCHVCRTPVPLGDVGFGLPLPPLDTADLEKAARAAVLEEIARHTCTRVPMAALVRQGDVAEEIASAADEMHADLIVMGTHARHGLLHFILGDPAEGVMRRSHVPVLVLPVSDAKFGPPGPSTH